MEYIDQKKTLAEIESIARMTKLYANGFKRFKNSNEIGFRFNQASWKANLQVGEGT